MKKGGVIDFTPLFFVNIKALLFLRHPMKLKTFPAQW
jgi:hypothetical protein